MINNYTSRISFPKNLEREFDEGFLFPKDRLSNIMKNDAEIKDLISCMLKNLMLHKKKAMDQVQALTNRIKLN